MVKSSIPDKMVGGIFCLKQKGEIMQYKTAKILFLCGLVMALASHAQSFSFYGVISTDTTWSDTVNVAGDVFVDSGATLTMLPGTTVLFADTTVWDTSYGIGKECDLIVRGELNIIGDELNKVYLTSSGRWGTLKMMNGRVEDSIIYVQIENNTVGLWMDSTTVFVKHTIFNNIFNGDYQDTLPEYFGSGIYALNCNITIDSCFISNCGKAYTGQATGIYLESTNAYIENNSIINILGSGYKYEFPSAYGIYMIGGDSLFCLNNFIANIKGGGMGVADLVRGGDGIGIYRKSGLYTYIEKTHIQTCIGGNGAWADYYVENNGGDGGDGIGVFIDSSYADIKNAYIDTCFGGDGGIVSKKGKTTYGGDGGDGICIKYRYSFGVLNSDTILYSHGGLGGWGIAGTVSGVSGMGIGVMLENNSNVIIGGSSDKRSDIYGSVSYYVYNNTGNNINATYNYWDTDDTTLIRAKIYDHFVNAAKGYVFIDPWITGVEGQPDAPVWINAQIEQNLPNPFCHKTSIKYQLQKPGLVRLKIYNLSGQLVRTLVDEIEPSGQYQVTWNAKAEKVTNGLYFYCLEFEGRKSVKRMTFVK